MLNILFEVSNKKAFLKQGKLFNADAMPLEEIKEMYYHK